MDIKTILESYGYKLIDNGKEWRTAALYRGGTNQRSLVIRKEDGVFFDHPKNIGGPFLYLMRLITNKSEEELQKMLSSYSLPEREDTPEITVEKKYKYPPEILDRLLPHYDFYEKNGISKETLQLFKIGLAQSGKLRNRYCFPIYDKSGVIIGFTGRWYKDTPPNGIAKYKHEGRRQDWVWPLHLCLPYIKEKREVMLVESPNCVLHLWEAGIRNVLCLFGTGMPKKLFLFLISQPEIERIVISTNNEPNNKSIGEFAAKKIKKELDQHFSPEKSFICLPTKKDFAKMHKAEILEWYNSNLLN